MISNRVIRSKFRQLKLRLDLVRLKNPENIVLFVTNRCNLKCRHCFYSESVNKGKIDELSLEEYGQIASSIKSPVSLNITGGEPFIRKDFLEVIDTFARTMMVKGISINTNGTMSDRIISFIIGFKQRHNIPVRLQVSIDGFGETHDRIRGANGAYASATELIRSISSRFKDVNVMASSTLNKRNLYEVVELSKHFEGEDIQHKFSVIRGNSFSTFGLRKSIISRSEPLEPGLALTADEIYEFIKRCKDERIRSLTCYRETMLQVMAETLHLKKRVIPCYAGSFDGVIYANGDVSLCEQVVPLGNLRKFNYDLGKIWNSNAAVKMRREIEKCACIHGCNISTSIGKNGIIRSSILDAVSCRANQH